eukprot:TRINITY_DN4275_c0_g1_i3.p1 TRINITY_DN4275_c0_g1~~TRINITY_DN4275_c0_g1_i3.p1  ORF type:complete len:464 (-),score=141.51 TRINITY_DN4275_c0_g1_i3:222-1613(-)
MSLSTMAFASRRVAMPARGSLAVCMGPIRASKRGLGDSVRGPQANDLKANAEQAMNFFTKGAVSYAEYKQQCVSLRMFAVAGVTTGCVLALLWDPPKSSYWSHLGPGSWWGSLKRIFGGTSTPMFLSEKSSSEDVAAYVSKILYESLAAPPPAVAAVAPKNAAFVFVKPHAVTPKVNKLVREGLQAKGLKILSEGDLTSDVIDKKKLIDQHYYAIASKATILKPSELNVPKDKFKAAFGLEWDDALAKGIVFNALDACKEFGCDADQLAEGWSAAKKAGKLVKFGGGFYCGLMNMNGKELYVFNAFFMSMRNAFTAPGKSIHYYTVEWDPKKLSWEDFRGKVLGPTDPAEAPKDSLRGKILAQWQSLGLKSKPNVGDNGVHASASPFEGLAERLNWLEVQCKADKYCKAMLNAGISEDTIKKWSVDPQVKIEASGKKGSLFDALEDMDADACIEKAKQLQAMQ